MRGNLVLAFEEFSSHIYMDFPNGNYLPFFTNIALVVWLHARMHSKYVRSYVLPTNEFAFADITFELFGEMNRLMDLQVSASYESFDTFLAPKIKKSLNHTRRSLNPPQKRYSLKRIGIRVIPIVVPDIIW